MRVLAVGLNPTLQRTIQVDRTLHNGVNRAHDARHDVAGKAANVARVLGQLGVDAIHLSHAGGENRDIWLEGCREDGMQVVAPEAPGEVRTCVTIVELDPHSTTEFIEPSAEVDGTTVRAVWDAFERELERSTVLLIGGSMAPGYPTDFYLRMMERAGDAAVPVGVDVSGGLLRETIKKGPELVKINAREFGGTFTPELKERLAEAESKSLSVLDMADVREKFLPIIRRLTHEGTTVVLSQGSQPSIVYDSESDRLHGVDVISMEPVNTIGCGDTMMAALAARFFSEEAGTGPRLAGAGLVEAVEYAHTLAAINASLLKPGTIRG
ncbi:MAG: 1-phosphofructokinase family hexose kinase [Alkalispirochaeta sp.]